MDKIEFLNCIKGPEQKSDEWKNLRMKYLTTSSYGTIFGVCNKYSSKDEVLIEKCLPPGMSKPYTSNVACEWGERYEQEAIDLYCKLMNKTNYNYGLLSYTQVDPVRKPEKWLVDFLEENKHLRTDIMACSPDGIAIDNDNKECPVLIEVKCPYRRKIIIGEIPEQYVSQVQMNMHILDLEKADFIEYRPPSEEDNTDAVINIVRVDRDPEYFKKHLVILNDFWKEIEEWRVKGIENHPKYERFMKKY
jgi:hypothetical protein